METENLKKDDVSSTNDTTSTNTEGDSFEEIQTIDAVKEEIRVELKKELSEKYITRDELQKEVCRMINSYNKTTKVLVKRYGIETEPKKDNISSEQEKKEDFNKFFNL